MAKEFRVRIPREIRHLFGGSARFRQRFDDEEKGRVWERAHQLEVERAKKIRRDRLESAAADLPTGAQILFRAAFAGWVKRAGLTESTSSWYVRHYKPHLKELLGPLPVSQISKARLLAHLEHRTNNGATASNIGRDITIVKAVVRWAQEHGYLVDVSVLLVRKPKATPTITRRYDPEAVDKFLAGAPTARHRAILELAAGSGMRGGEIRAMDCSWIRWNEGRIHIPCDSSFSPKGREARSVPLHDKLEATLKAWLGDRRQGLVFPPLRLRSGHGENKGVDINLVFQQTKAASKVEFNGMHDFRHHCISWLFAMGVDPLKIMKIAGHKNIMTTMKYAHVGNDYFADVREKLNGAKVGAEVGAGPQLRSVK